MQTENRKHNAGRPWTVPFMAAIMASVLASALPAAGTPAAASGRWSLDLEGGPVFSGYNDVQIPNPGGTRFSLSRDFHIPSRLYVRGRLSWKIASRHTLSALYAPLTFKASGKAAGPITFFGQTFPAGSDVAGTYTFNSYRLTYRYSWVEKARLSLGVGFTAKIRDAVLGLRSGSLRAEKKNVGFVPLLNLLLHWRWSERFGLRLEADALAAPQGRAEDVLLAVV